MRAPEDVCEFWFVTHGQKDWFGGKPEFDKALAEQFAKTHHAVATGEAFTWRKTVNGRLAEIIVLDQFSRQLHRGASAAFAQDPMALALAQEVVASGADLELPTDQRTFIYMPYMHSESLLVHEEAMRLFAAMGNESLLDFEQRHADLIRRFGRFPKRNEALGRVSSPEEIAYIAETDGMF